MKSYSARFGKVCPDERFVAVAVNLLSKAVSVDLKVAVQVSVALLNAVGRMLLLLVRTSPTIVCESVISALSA